MKGGGFEPRHAAEEGRRPALGDRAGVGNRRRRVDFLGDRAGRRRGRAGDAVERSAGRASHVRHRGDLRLHGLGRADLGRVL